LDHYWGIRVQYPYHTGIRPGAVIGFAIEKRMLDRYGDRIRVEATPGEGSTFCFILPPA